MTYKVYRSTHGFAYAIYRDGKCFHTSTRQYHTERMAASGARRSIKRYTELARGY